MKRKEVERKEVENLSRSANEMRMRHLRILALNMNRGYTVKGRGKRNRSRPMTRALHEVKG